MPAILVKRSSETLLSDIDCSLLLGPFETITAVTNIAADANTGSALTFGTPSLNTVPITYPDRRVVPAGKVIQVLIGGGSVEPTAFELAYTVRARFATSNPGETREATVQLLVIDRP